MNWILLTTITFLTSVILYVFVRLGKARDIQTGILNLSMFALPAILTAIYLLIDRSLSFSITLEHLSIIFIASLFFSYLGNFLSIKGIQYAENPGFSLMLQKSYGALTLFLAPLFFESEIDLQGIAGTLLIIVFGFVLSHEKGKRIISRDNKWIIFTMGAFLGFAMLTLTAKYLFLHGVNVYTYLFYLFTFVSVFGLIQLSINRKQVQFNKNLIFIILMIGLMSFLFNIFLNLALKEAPNIGYVNSANAGSIAALTVVSAVIFKDKLNIKKLIGVLGILGGLLLIFL